MGSAGSAPSKECEDSWWRSSKSQENNVENVPKPETTTQGIPEDISRDTCEFGEESWLKQIQDLGKVVQHLASENVKLLVINKELRLKCEGRAREQRNPVNAIDKESGTGGAVCHSLENRSLVIDKEICYENSNALKVKLHEYQGEIEKLKRDSSEKNETVKDLQYLLQVTDEERKAAEEKTQGVNAELEAMRNEYSIMRDKIESLQGQISNEKDQQEKLCEENGRLRNELKTLKEQCVSELVTKAIVPESSEKGHAGGGEAAPVTDDASGEEQARSLTPSAAAELELFQNQLKIKREARHKALSALSAEMERLRRELNTEREARKNAIKELEDMRIMSDGQHVSLEVDHLRSKLSSEHEEKEKISKQLVQIQKQGSEEIENIVKELKKERAKTENMQGENKYMKEQLEESDQMLQQKSEENTQLQTELESQREKHQQQVSALKEVITLSKQLLAVRERQVDYLKQTLDNIEVSVVEKRHGSLSAGLKAEYETQIQNIKTLKSLYEEKSVILNAEKEKLLIQQKELLDTVDTEKRKSESLEQKLQEKEAVISERNETVSSLQDQLSDSLDRSKNLSYELTLINNMFTQILGSNDMDLDRLTKLLQENHDLITEITTKGDSSEVTASLPKLLLDLISDIEVPDCVPDKTETEHGEEENAVAMAPGEQNEAKKEGTTLGMQDISSTLPKVWRVLTELISHHIEPTCSDFSPEECKSTCYKSIETPYGPKSVISVSKTFLRIRDLILQKTSFQKEVTRLKQLNGHLETKLNDQERRLSLVSSELRKTWNVVDQMHIQHQQLHTHEKVLRYELQQKRKLLQQLKEELEYCKEKWEEARKKNRQTEVDWRNLRKEFAMRKMKPDSPLNNSEESGFSDEKEDDGSDNDTPVSSKKRGSDAKLTYTKGDENEPVQDNHPSPSLPDLVSATAEVPLSQSVTPSQTSSFLSVQIKGNASHSPKDISVQESSEIEECPTASLISLLKLQLSCFSKNLEIITAGLDNHENFRALQSIFTLPAIQIPDHLHPIPNPNYNCPSTSYATSLINTEPSAVSGGITRTENICAERLEKTNSEVSSCETDTQNDDCRNKHSVTNDKTENVALQTASSSSSTHIVQSSDVSNATASSPESPDCADVGTLLMHGLTNGRVNIGQPQESRSERLKRLEKQCQELFQKVTQSSTAPITQEKSVPPSTSAEIAQEPSRNLEDMLDARAARLNRLEEQSQQLFKKVTKTTHRSEALSNRLEALHEQYGSDDSGSNSSESQASAITSSHEIDSEYSSGEIPQPPPLPDAPLDQAATVTQNSNSSRSLEEILEARAARMKRLEEESQQLFKKVTRTTHRSEALSNRLEELHEQYGSEDSGSRCSATPANASKSATAFQSSSSLIPQPPHLPVVSPDQAPSCSSRSLEEILESRASKMRRLEEESQKLFNKVTRTTHHSETLSNKLEELHEQYGNEDAGSNSSESRPNIAKSGLETTSQSTVCHIPQPPSLPITSIAHESATTQSSSSSSRSCDDVLEARAASFPVQVTSSEELHEHCGSDTAGNSEKPHGEAFLPVPEAGAEPNPSSASSHLPNQYELSETCSQSTPNDISTSLLPTTSNEPAIATTSSCNSSTQSLEDRLDARAARLKRLEEQSQQLFTKVTRTTRRSTVLSNRLQELHEQYGSDEASSGAEAMSQNTVGEPSGQVPPPPPLPEVPRERELPTVISGQQTLEEASVCLTQPGSTNHIPPPPPFPTVLPPIRIPTETTAESDSQVLNDLQEQ